jgi:glycosyltransferase involved in cell wall biosynthesis
MNWYPNLHAMTRFLDTLWPRIKSRAPGVRLVIAGMNPPQSLVARGRSDASIDVTGFVEDIRPVIDAAALYVCPILDGGGTRLKLLDAMAMGKPIVATPFAIEGLDVRDGHDVIVREFGEAFVDAVVCALGDHGMRKAIGDNARATAMRHYAWAGIGRRLHEAYQAAAQRREEPPDRSVLEA